MSDSGQTTVVFDRESVLDMVDGEVEFMHELIEMYLDDAPEHLDTIRRGFEGNDADAVQRIAHRLKTSVGNLGGRVAQPLVKDLEQQARTGSLDGAHALFAQVENALQEFESSLRSCLDEGC